MFGAFPSSPAPTKRFVVTCALPSSSTPSFSPYLPSSLLLSSSPYSSSPPLTSSPTNSLHCLFPPSIPLHSYFTPPFFPSLPSSTTPSVPYPSPLGAYRLLSSLLLPFSLRLTFSPSILSLLSLPFTSPFPLSPSLTLHSLPSPFFPPLRSPLSFSTPLPIFFSPSLLLCPKPPPMTSTTPISLSLPFLSLLHWAGRREEEGKKV